MKHWSDTITHDACLAAVEWLHTQPDAEIAWQQCARGDWMLWLLGKQAGKPGSDARRPLVLAACACARLALPYVRAGELRPLRAIETAEAWARGGADAPTLDAVRTATITAAAAYAASDAASDAAIAAAAYAASNAASDAASDPASNAASDAASAAAYAAAYATYASVRTSMLAKCANIVRQFYQHVPI